MKKIAFALACLVCVAGLGGCKEKEEITVYMPDGAPAIALAGMMSEYDEVTYKVVPPSLIASKVTAKAEKDNADFCVLPITAASKLLGKGDRYTLLGIVTHGNLYLVSKEETIENLSALIGKKVGVLQIKEVPGLTFKATLNKYQIPWQEIGNDGGMVEDKVNLIAITDATAVGTVNADYFLIAEPAASAQSKKGYQIVGDLQALYGGEEGYPQAALVAKNSFTEEKREWTAQFVERLENSVSWWQTKSGEEIVSVISAHLEDKTATSSLKAPLLTSDALGRCGIGFRYAMGQETQIQEFLTQLLTVNQTATAMPLANFFWKYGK